MADEPKPGAPNKPAEAPVTKVEDPKPVTPPAEAPKPGDGQPKPGEAPKAPVETPKPAAAAPEKYTLVVPDTAKNWIDDKDLARVSALAKANDWTNAEAQEYVEQIADGAIEASTEMLTEFKANKTYGSTNAEETQRLANLALDKLRPATHELAAATRAMLLKTGYGNNLLVISLLADMGKQMAEDGGPLNTSRGAAIDANTPMHERIYGKEQPKTS